MVSRYSLQREGSWLTRHRENARQSTKEDQTEALVRKARFKRWFESSILELDAEVGGDHRGLGNVMIHVISDDEVEYRDEYNESDISTH